VRLQVAPGGEEALKYDGPLMSLRGGIFYIILNQKLQRISILKLAPTNTIQSFILILSLKGQF
jgi:hypothetical protein